MYKIACLRAEIEKHTALRTYLYGHVPYLHVMVNNELHAGLHIYLRAFATLTSYTTHTYDLHTPPYIHMDKIKNNSFHTFLL